MARTAGVVAGTFARAPAGIILHGSRSGLERSTRAEYDSTVRYAFGEPNGYGWNATVGEDELTVHMELSQWGWNARGCSPLYLAVEFAQGTELDAISDGQVRAFAEFVYMAVGVHPSLPLHFPTHAELDGTPAYGGKFDGKSDVFPSGDARASELRDRILAAL